MVTGTIKKTEKAYESALREIKEETGLSPLQLWVVPHVNSFYDPDKDELNFIPVFAAMVNNNSIVKLSAEHSDYKWVTKEEAIKLLAWPGQRKSVDIIHQYFMKEDNFLSLVEIDIKL